MTESGSRSLPYEACQGVGGDTGPRRYRYVGPAEVRDSVRPEHRGAVVRTEEDCAEWLASRTAGELAEPFTYVIGTDGLLRLAPRRSEHVACGSGEPVWGAGEIAFRYVDGRWVVDEVSNQSTGYCPDVTSWRAVAEALDLVGLGHPDGFTHEVLFRRCPVCRENNVVREEHFVCVFCDADLPAEWNIDPVVGTARRSPADRGFTGAIEIR